MSLPQHCFPNRIYLLNVCKTVKVVRLYLFLIFNCFYRKSKLTGYTWRGNAGYITSNGRVNYNRGETIARSARPVKVRNRTGGPMYTGDRLCICTVRNSLQPENVIGWFTLTTPRNVGSSVQNGAPNLRVLSFVRPRPTWRSNEVPPRIHNVPLYVLFCLNCIPKNVQLLIYILST